MIRLPEKEELELYKSLFRGRQDVFARHWQQAKKQGYMPAYQYDPYMYRLHKMNGGSFRNYSDKTFLPLSDEQLLKHLKGEQLVGVYPLMQNNTSWFLAADFDKDNWGQESKAFQDFCRGRGIPAYLERSRSGNGGHVWIFFDQPYPAVRSRKIFKSFLEQSGSISLFDKGSSFDRLFPNQDFLSGKGLGNLIALPLYRPALEKENSCFVNDDLQPYKDQWEFLRNVEKAKVSTLDNLYESLIYESSVVKNQKRFQSKDTSIILQNAVIFNKSKIHPELIKFLKDNLNFSNPEFFIKKKSGKNTWGTLRYFNFIEETDESISVPRGSIGKILRFCKKENFNILFEDRRKKPREILYFPKLELRLYQQQAITAARKKDFGIITAPPGSGKTIIGLQVIAEKKLPALIIVHRKQLMEQWIDRIEGFLGIPRKEIGRIGQGRAKIGKAITVAMVQSLRKQLEKKKDQELENSFGTLIVDECHHIPAETYRKTISKLAPFYQYGLTATPFRKFQNGEILFSHLGDIIAKVEPQDMKGYQKPRVVIRDTVLNIPYDSKTDSFEVLSKVLVHDSTRNRLIFEDVIAELNKGRKVVLLTERKDHIDILYQFFKQSFEAITLSGEDSESSRKTKWQMLEGGNYQVLITTGQYFGEGTDLQNASCLFLVYPFSFKGKLIQYIGRVQRSEKVPVIYDYRDSKIAYLEKLFLKRNVHYRKFDRQATLFDEEEKQVTGENDFQTLDRAIKIPFEELDFRYGAVAFKYEVPKKEIELEFEIENDHFRPEFDVLKPYFAKVLRSKVIEVHVFAEINKGKILSQLATSKDLEKINHKIIEGVKFRFLEKDLIRRGYEQGQEEDLLGVDQLKRGSEGGSFYDTEESLMKNLLQNNQYRHYKQLRFLSSVHDSSKFRLRFVLDPFSFVFFVSGDEQYHIVLETLDTEEATYVWHFKKQDFETDFRRFNEHLNIIRNKGRQIFLESQPENFSRIFHDYSEERKGFIIWKGLLEERLV